MSLKTSLPSFSRFLVFKKLSRSSITQYKGKLSAKEKLALAITLKCKKVINLQFDFKIKAFEENSWDLSGNISGVITQICVVSLEDVKSRVNIKVKRQFIPDKVISKLSTQLSTALNFETDPLTNSIDLADIVVEELILELPNYPRKGGVYVKDVTKKVLDDTTYNVLNENPFAILAKLKSTRDKIK